MTDEQSVFVDIIGRGNTVDIMPRVRAVLAECRWAHDFTPREVAELVEQSIAGKYIPVSIQDRIEDRRISALIGPVIGYFRSLNRIDQIRDLSESWGDGAISAKLYVTSACCQKALAASKRLLKPSDLEPLPLAGCDQYICHCDYLTERKKRTRK